MIADLKSYYIDKIQEKDAWNLCNLMVANEDRFKTFFPETLASNLTPDLSKHFTSKKVKEYNLNEEFLFTIKEKAANNLIGLVYIKELDWAKKQGEFAYCIGYQYARKGIISKSVKKLSEYAFNSLDLKTLQIIVHKSNTASLKVAENNNFQWIKTLKNKFTPNGKEPLDMDLYELNKI